MASYSITTSARSRNVSGIVNSIFLAVLAQVVSNLEQEDMLAIVAYLASLDSLSGQSAYRAPYTATLAHLMSANGIDEYMAINSFGTPLDAKGAAALSC